MKKALALLMFSIAFALPAFADVEPIVSLPSSVEMKQGGIVKWSGEDQKLENLTTVTVARTKKIDSLGRWNALWEGLEIDLGIAYDANTLDTVALMLGKNLGNLDQYLPIELPLADRVNISVYPIGLYVDNITEGDTTISGASGVALVKFDLSF